MSKCIWIIGTPRSLSNYVGCYLHACGIPAWLTAPTNQPNEWNQTWSEDPELAAIIRMLLPVHLDIGLPMPVTPARGHPGRANLIEYLQRRDREQPGDFALKSNWLPFVADTVLTALPNREHVVVRCSRPRGQSSASLKALMPNVAANVVANYIRDIDVAADTLVGRVSTIHTLDIAAVRASVRAGWAPVVAGLGLQPTEEAWATFDSEKVRF